HCHHAFSNISLTSSHFSIRWSIDVGWASTWVKIMNEWLAFCIYVWRLISPALARKQPANDEESASTT
uniref:Uncharacterized protein n=1 Tax=Aegilops tauschii subsp. strangulata TaxID=200361 RepID=A0A453CD98_AEGTS